jgi:hypothetical protein
MPQVLKHLHAPRVRQRLTLELKSKGVAAGEKRNPYAVCRPAVAP